VVELPLPYNHARHGGPPAAPRKYPAPVAASSPHTLIEPCPYTGVCPICSNLVVAREDLTAAWHKATRNLDGAAMDCPGIGLEITLVTDPEDDR